MRRPLKPFVTEYKGNRRASAAFSEPATFESERPAPKLAEARPKPDSDDSYEAAMRAADALFSAPARRQIDAGDETQQSPAQPPAGSADPTPPDRNGGRILRVIDEAPPPQFAALEAEFAPKRRGRKPGSKNKPKVPAAAPAFQPHVFDSQTLETRASEPQAIGTRTVRSALPASGTAAHVAGSAPRQVTALSSATPAARGEKRYPWVRDRLKPGEDWKRRRLPRVCW